MSDYLSLKATITANIKANNNQEITGAITNSVLNAMVDSLGAGYQFKGVATPTNPGSAQTPDYKCFYLATTPGTYANLGGLVVADGEVAILKYDTSWTKVVTGIATAESVSQLDQTTNKKVPFQDSLANAAIPVLYVDVTGYTGSADISQLSIRNVYAGTSNYWGVALNDANGQYLADAQIIEENAKPKSVEHLNNNGIYIYAEFNWDVLPQLGKNYFNGLILSNYSFLGNSKELFTLKNNVDSLLANQFYYRGMLTGGADLMSNTFESGVYSFVLSNVSNYPNMRGESGFFLYFSRYIRMVVDQSYQEIWIMTEQKFGWVSCDADNRKKVDGLISFANLSLANNTINVTGSDETALETNVGSLLKGSTGLPVTFSDPSYVTKKYALSPGTLYLIKANANFSNTIYSIFDSEMNLISKEQAQNVGENPGVIKDFLYYPNTRDAYLYVGFRTNIENGGLFSSPYKENAGVKWKGKKWAVIGDSLTELNSRTTIHYFDYVREITGISVVNVGKSGTGYMKQQENNLAFYQRLSSVPTDDDVVTIFGSGNDVGLPLGSVTDTGTTTICGCINKTLDDLLNRFVTAGKVPTIGVVTPTPWIGQGPDDPNGAMALYCDAIIEICKRKSIPVLDLYHKSNLHPDDADFRALAYSKDDGNGVHPDETGHKIIAPMFESFLDSLLLNP